MPFSPRASPVPVPEQDDAPFSTQATLIASPLAAEKQRTPAPAPTPTKVVEARVSTGKPTAPPSSQQTMVMTQERVVVQRARVRGASAQPGPSVPRETRTRGGVPAVGAPDRNTRARSRSVDPQPQPKSRGKGKAKEKALVSIERDVHVEDEQGETYSEEDVGSVPVTGGLSIRETFEDEMVVEELLEASVASGVDGADGGNVESVHDEDDGGSDQDGDEDGDSMPELPRFQEIEIGSEPSDSDDAETHGSLVPGAGGGESDRGQDQDQDQDQNEDGDDEDGDEDGDEDEDEEDADRIERMASGSLHAPAPTPPQPRVTRSMAATQTQKQPLTQIQTRSQTQTRTYPQISPRRTRSGNQARAGPQQSAFPSPGTKARAVVDRFQEEEKKVPYAPPAGSRAARAVRGRRRRG